MGLNIETMPALFLSIVRIVRLLISGHQASAIKKGLCAVESDSLPERPAFSEKGPWLA
jgi:hypothetical protein